MKDLNITAKPMKILEENTGGNLHDHDFGTGFLDMIPKYEQKQKTDKLDLIKIKNFMHERTLSRMKRQPIDYAKTFANHIPD